MNKYLLFPATLLLVLSCGEEQSSTTDKEKDEEYEEYAVGYTLPDWSAGYLDIHMINSARGECFLYILPDGTTMMVDAGEVSAGTTSLPQRPSNSQSPRETYSKYIRHFLKATGSDRLDYVLLTHFHMDHMGRAKLAYSNENGYAHMGLCGVYDDVKFNTLIDRGWPSYGDDPSIYFALTDDEDTDGDTSNSTPDYIRFARYVSEHGTVVERFKVSTEPQITMKKGGEGKYDLKIINVIGNGVFLTGNTASSVTDSHTPTSENQCSCGFHLRYGGFDMLACGDLTGAPQNRLITNYFANCINSLECFKAHHHLKYNSWGTQMSNEKYAFHPQIVLAQCGDKTGSQDDAPKVILKAAAGGDVFMTNADRETLAAKGLSDALKAYNGHFVVRVAEDGTFYVYQLTDTDNEYRIKSKFGPYHSR